jgi:hypothetical protein
MSNEIDLAFDLPSQADIDKMFHVVPKIERYKALDKVVSAGAKVIAKRARELAPRSAQTGSAKKRTAKQWQEADWEYPLWKTIKHIVRKYQYHAHGVVGPEWPKGNKAYLNTSPKGRVKVLWGKKTGQIVPQVRNWIVQAFDETRPQQLDAMRKELNKFVEQLFSKNG